MTRIPLGAPCAAWGVVLALVVAGGMACSSPRPPSTCDGCNVVLVVADTLRADRLASYGYARVTSPSLDAFAAANIRFAYARSAAACTFPSVNSLLTSRPPFRFRDSATRPGIPDNLDALPTLLQNHGYVTAAVSASPIVRRSPGRYNPVGGFGRGFDRFDEGCTWRGAHCVNRRVRQWIPTLEPPFFLYLHYMDPHDPYRPPAAISGHFSNAYAGTNPRVAKGDPNPFSAHVREGGDPEALPGSDVAHLSDLYDESILAFDHGFAALLAMLDRAGRTDDTIVVVVSDHGESFLEHGRMKHCNHVYDTETHVPMVLRLPAVTSSRVVEPAVANVDLVPTLFDYLGLDASGLGFTGVSLRPWIEQPERAPDRLVYSAMGRQRSATDGRFKLVLELGATRRYQLFDLQEDPGETHDVGSAHPRILRTSKIELDRWIAQAEPGNDAERTRREREVEDELRALGYLQ